MKKFLILFSCAVLLISSFSFFAPLSSLDKIYTDIIRLHIVANSDSETDQKLKLAVRDRVITLVKQLTKDCKSSNDAAKTLKSSLPELEALALSVIKEEGFEYDVQSTLKNEYYPTREYEDLTLPSGEYNSLRIVIGEGKGQNWWCVLFPPVCVGSSDTKEELLETGFTTEQIKVITESDSEQYKVKFKCLEYFSDVKNKFKKLFN